jgi:DNA segregation ATPase FtsK/SpoIIIE, S-DNA-T family
VTVAGTAVTCLAALRLASPRWFTRLISAPVRDRWRWWCYRRRWQAVMTISRLAPRYQGRVLLPVLGQVAASRFTDRVTVGMVSGQTPDDFADRAEGLAHGFRVRQCRVRTGRPGTIVLELVRRDALAEPMPALPIPAVQDLRALPVGRREDGAVLTLRRLRGRWGRAGAGQGDR